MCTAQQLNEITFSVAEAAKRLFGERFVFTVLYGSYARGDNDNDSDVDILVCVDCARDDLHKYRFQLSGFASRLSLENDVTVSVLIIDSESFNRYKNHLPFYENIEKEGVRVA